MELLFIVINKDEYCEKILSLLAELEVSGATIFESEAMGHFLAHEVPIFAGLRQLIGKQKTPNKTVMALIDTETFLPQFKKLLAEENIDFTQPGMGCIITVPTSTYIKSEQDIV